MTTLDEPVDKRYKIRFTSGDPNPTPIGHGYSIKLSLIDVENLLLYQSILEVTYSSVNRIVKEKTAQAPLLRKKVTQQKVPWNEDAIQFLSKSFIEDAGRTIGESYTLLLKRAVKKLRLKIPLQ